ncbi:MAG: hypothetical protein KAR11_03900 [Phycisphaerae bacterium]|nr:hypothetical protein [Phycisphaerae bacterium]
MKKFKELVASDFSNVDSRKFDEWKTAVLSARRNTVILIVGLIVANVLLILFSGTLVLGGLLLVLLFIFVWNKAGRLQKELGIDKAAIKRAKTLISTVGPKLAKVSMHQRRGRSTLGGSLLLIPGLLFLLFGVCFTFGGVEDGLEHIVDLWYIALPLLIVGSGLTFFAVRLIRGRIVEAYQCLGCGQHMPEYAPSCVNCKVDFGQGCV